MPTATNKERRDFLAILGGFALAGLTGCGGGGGAGNSGATANTSAGTTGTANTAKLAPVSGTPAITTTAASTVSAVAAVIKTPLLIPAYFFDPLLWTQILPSHVPAHCFIVNVATGPGAVLDPVWDSRFKQAKLNGHQLVAYVDTAFGAKTVAAVQAEINLWNTLYGIQDIFLDQVGDPVGAITSNLMYYTTLVNGIRKTKQTARVILNCGTVPVVTYFQIDTLTEIVVFEDTWAVFQARVFPAWLNSYWQRSHIIVHTAPATSLNAVNKFAGLNKAAGYFVTDATTTTYTLNLPSYWNAELAL